MKSINLIYVYFHRRKYVPKNNKLPTKIILFFSYTIALVQESET